MLHTFPVTMGEFQLGGNSSFENINPKRQKRRPISWWHILSSQGYPRNSRVFLDQDSLVMAVKRFSLTTFWEVCRSSRWKPWPEETLRLDFKIAKMLLCGAFLEVECDV